MNGTNSNEGQPEYKPLDFGDVLKRAFDLYKENLGLLIVVHLVGGLLFFAVCYPLSLMAARWEGRLKARDRASVEAIEEKEATA